jgi:hypothetical protein
VNSTTRNTTARAHRRSTRLLAATTALTAFLSLGTVAATRPAHAATVAAHAAVLDAATTPNTVISFKQDDTSYRIVMPGDGTGQGTEYTHTEGTPGWQAAPVSGGDAGGQWAIYGGPTGFFWVNDGNGPEQGWVNSANITMNVAHNNGAAAA